jgi:ketosteroid isomerase-like protein
MKNSFFIFFLLLVSNVFAQTAQTDINNQVWRPFLKSFNDHDTKAFLSIHSKDVIRAPRDAKTVWNWSEYFTQQEKGDTREKASNTKRTLELRFTERIADKEKAVEVGIYKTTYINPDGVPRSFYGRFHVVLRKEQGTWKILVDTDSSENNSISEKDYLAASAME